MVAGLRLLRAILLIKLVPLPSSLHPRPSVLSSAFSSNFFRVVHGLKVVRLRLKRRDNEHKFHRCGGVTLFCLALKLG